MKIIEGDFAHFPAVLPDEVCPSTDIECSIEGRVWDDLQAEVANGWRTSEEADALFYSWRQARITHLGSGVLQAS